MKKKRIDIYREQRKVLHYIYMDLCNYYCAEHKKLKNKIQLEIDELSSVIREWEFTKDTAKHSKAKREANE